MVGIGREVAFGGESDVLGLDEGGGTVRVVVLRRTNEDLAVCKISVHELKLAHKLAGELARFGVEIYGGTEGNGAKVLGAGFVIIPELVASFVMGGVDIADTATKRGCAIIPNGEAEHLGLGAVLIGLVAIRPEVSATHTGGFGEGLADEPLGDVKGGTRIFDFVNNEDVFAVESGRSLADGINIFVVDTPLYIQGAKARKIGRWDIGGLEVAESLAALRTIRGFNIAIGTDGGAAATEPRLAVDVEVRMNWAWSVGEIRPKNIGEPADGTSGFVEIDDVVRLVELRVIVVFGGSTVEGGDEIGSVGDIGAESFVDIPVMASVVAPMFVKFVLALKDGVVSRVGVETFGGCESFWTLGIFWNCRIP